MREIGGYLELEHFNGSMLHDDGILLNCGRNALAYLIEAKGIKRIKLPYFLCDAVTNVCKKYGVQIEYYHIDKKCLPIDIDLTSGEWLYVVNFYGQISRDKLQALANRYSRIIVDNAQAYFESPLPGIDTIYTCRKFFGVSDGGILYTNTKTTDILQKDESFERMHFVFGRFEREASEFYQEASKNNDFFDNEPIKRMSRLTKNILHGLDYAFIQCRRTENFSMLNKNLSNINRLKVNDVQGAFMYPLMIDEASKIKKKLLEHKIYIPTLWPNVVNDLPHDWWEWKLANNILPLPCDQRYGIEEMHYILRRIKECFL